MKKNKNGYSGNYYCHNKLISLCLSVIDFSGGLICNCLKKRHKPKHINKILLSRIDHLGDVLMLTTVVNAIKEYFPKVDIYLLLGSGSKSLCTHIKGIKEYYFFDVFFVNREKKSSIYKAFKMIKQFFLLIFILKEKKIDVGIDFRPHVGNSLSLLKLSGSKYIIGYKNGGFGFLCDSLVKFDQSRHFIENMFDCVKLLVPNIEPTDYRIVFEINKYDTDILNTINGLKKYFVIHSFAGNKFKMWPLENWEKLLLYIETVWNGSIVFLGSKDESDMAINLLNGKDEHKYFNFVGKTSINETAILIEKSEFFLGLDSLLVHIAAAFNKKCFIINSGIENPAQWVPWQTDYKLFTYPVPCSPCRLAAACEKMECIRNVSAEQVYSEIKAFL